MRLQDITILREAKEDQIQLAKLPYKMTELAPILSEDNVKYHYNVLTKGYVNRYNAGEGDPDFNYGGAMLHNLFWTQLKAPGGANAPVGNIKTMIDDKYENIKGFTEELIKTATSIQGSGWAYLSKSGELKTTPNQSYKTDILMPIDLWEHSFVDYIPSKDAKKKYLQNMLKIVDWTVINNRLDG